MEDTPMPQQFILKEEIPNDRDQPRNIRPLPIVVPKPKLESISKTKVISSIAIPLYIRQIDYTIQNMLCTFYTQPGQIQRCHQRGQTNCLAKLQSPSPVPNLQELQKHLKLSNAQVKSESFRIVEEQEKTKVNLFNPTNLISDISITIEDFPKENTASSSWIVKIHQQIMEVTNNQVNKESKALVLLVLGIWRPQF